MHGFPYKMQQLHLEYSLPGPCRHHQRLVDADVAVPALHRHQCHYLPEKLICFLANFVSLVGYLLRLDEFVEYDFSFQIVTDGEN